RLSAAPGLPDRYNRTVESPEPPPERGPTRMTAPTYQKLTPPAEGTRVTFSADGKPNVPDDPVVCLIRGDGIGADVGGVPGITTCAVRVLDAAVRKAYGGKRKIVWF